MPICIICDTCNELKLFETPVPYIDKGRNKVVVCDDCKLKMRTSEVEAEERGKNKQ